eukprot:gene4852-8437_t
MFLSSESLKNDEFLELLDPSEQQIKRYMDDPIYISILGTESSGKTTFIKAQLFLHRTEDCFYDETKNYEEGQETVITDGTVKNLNIPCTVFEITSDDYRKQAFHPQMISKSEGYLVLVDASDLTNCYTEVNKIIKNITTFHDKDIPMHYILVGNKSDKVTNEVRMSKSLGTISDKFFKTPYFETSSEQFKDVETPFTTLINKILKNRKESGFIEKGHSFEKI